MSGNKFYVCRPIELAPGSVEGFVVENAYLNVISIHPMENQTISSLAENMVSCFKKNPGLEIIECRYGNVGFSISREWTESKQIVQYIDELVSQNPSHISL